MRKPVQRRRPSRRIDPYVLSFVRVIPVIGLMCTSLPGPVAAQDTPLTPPASAVDKAAPPHRAVSEMPAAAGTGPSLPADRPGARQDSVTPANPGASAPVSAPPPAIADGEAAHPGATPTGLGGAREDVAPLPSDATTSVGPLPDELSPWSMFLHADVIVKAVMLGLALASIVTWTVWLAKVVELRRAKRSAQAALGMLLSTRSLAEAAAVASRRRHVVAQLIAAAQTELRESPDLRHEGIKERLSWQLDRIEVAAGRHIARGMSILATVGAVAPFVGLFGTVWGIMNSFVGISRAHTTNLAVVAPGIAEALLATAFGLAAAIPAVVIYNAFTRSIGGYRAVLADASIAVLRLVSRDLDRQAVAIVPAENLGVAKAPPLSISQAAE
jgi:biopolymer transport protein ExbB